MLVQQPGPRLFRSLVSPGMSESSVRTQECSSRVRVLDVWVQLPMLAVIPEGCSVNLGLGRWPLVRKAPGLFERKMN